MKKYNKLIIVSIGLWLLLSLSFGAIVLHMEQTSNKAYKIDMNRIEQQLLSGVELAAIDVTEYEHILSVARLEAGEENKEVLEAFYQPGTDEAIEIHPFYQEGKLDSYLRFTYRSNENGKTRMLLLLELGMFLMEGVLLVFLCYLKQHIIRPFTQLITVPYELAKGHLHGEIKEEKSRYFGKFVWGISQLRDTLALTKRKEMQLMKEKKLMLMSLSHDIKTPLNTIKLYARALETEMYQEKGKRQFAAHQIGEKTVEIEGYVNQIMQAAKEDILDLPVTMGEFYLDVLIEQVNKTYQEKCQIRKVDFIIDTFENKLIKGDMERTLEVIENIMENAFKYGDGRKIQISSYEEEDYTLIKIYNTGDVVEENDFHHIFDSFFRGRNSEGKLGDGLGLYICREIMSKMGGEIFAERQPDGMAFVLVFL